MEGYRRKKLEYNNMCERKKEEENDRWQKWAEGVTNEKEMWEIINRERKGRERINEGISMEEWKEHFMRLLGGNKN